MVRRTVGSSLAAVLAVCLVCVGLGCSDDDPSQRATTTTSGTSTGTGGTGVAGGTGGAGGAGGAIGGTGGGGGGEPAGITIAGHLSQMPNFSPDLAEGDVCFISEGAADLCTPIDENGDYALEGVPANTVGALRFRNPEIVTFYMMMTTDDQDVTFNAGLDTPAVVQSYYDQTSITPNPDGVVVLLEIFPLPQPDYEAVLTPSNGDGPYYYLTPGATIDLNATATNDNAAMGVYLNVDQTGGPYSLSFVQGATTCNTPSYGADRLPWDVPPDADIVYMAFTCP